MTGFSFYDSVPLKSFISRRYCSSTMSYHDVASRMDWKYETEEIKGQDISK